MAKKYLQEVTAIQESSHQIEDHVVKIEKLRRSAELQFKSQQLVTDYHCDCNSGIMQVVSPDYSYVSIDFKFPDSIVKISTILSTHKIELLILVNGFVRSTYLHLFTLSSILLQHI